MARDLLGKIRKRRECKVVIGRFTFTVRRPTDVEAIALHRSDSAFNSIAADFVCGWEGVTTDDLIGDKTADPVPFDAELWREWCADRPDFWGPIANAALDAYREHAQQLEEAAKN